MSDLQTDYFKRPLSPDEEKRLAAELEASDEACLAFAQAAEADYAQSGFPQPALSAGTGRKLWVLAALLAGGTAWAAWSVMAPEASVLTHMAPQQTVDLTQRTLEHREMPVPRHEAPVMPAKAIAPDSLSVQRYGSDFVLTVGTQQKGHAALELRSLDGTVLRVLYEGSLKAGDWAFRWDGSGADGQPLQPGRYRLQLSRAHGQTLGKTVQVEAR